MKKEKLSIQFKALADPIRLRILFSLNRVDEKCCSPEDRVCACNLEEITGLSQPATSHHLKILTQAGLIESEKEGRFIYYRIHRTHFAQLRSFLDEFINAPALFPNNKKDHGVSHHAS